MNRIQKWRLEHRNKRRFGTEKNDFEIDSLQVSWHFLERSRVFSIREEQYELIAQENGLRTFTELVAWDGSGLVEFQSDSQYYIIKPVKIWGGFGYQVEFFQSLNKGDKVNIKVSCQMKDFGQAASNVLLKEIRYPTRYLSLNISLPMSQKPTNSVYFVLKNLTAHWDYRETNVLTEKKGQCEIHSTIQKPVQYRCYGIMWGNS